MPAAVIVERRQCQLVEMSATSVHLGSGGMGGRWAPAPRYSKFETESVIESSSYHQVPSADFSCPSVDPSERFWISLIFRLASVSVSLSVSVSVCKRTRICFRVSMIIIICNRVTVLSVSLCRWTCVSQILKYGLSLRSFKASNHLSFFDRCNTNSFWSV